MHPRIKRFAFIYPHIKLEPLEGLDEAVIGIAERKDFTPTLCYSVEKAAKIIEANSPPDMTYEKAIQFIKKNYMADFRGPQSPVWVTEFKHD